MSLAYIALGSNLGDSVVLVKQALQALAALPECQLTAQSRLYRSAPIDAGGDDYINAVVQLSTQLHANELLRALQSIELRHGRHRSYQNAPRTLDLDLLLFEQQQIAEPDLQVPHPRMHLRAFVLQPLLEIAPQIEIPGLGRAAQFLPATANQALQPL